MSKRHALLGTIVFGFLGLLAVHISEAATRWDTDGLEEISLNGQCLFRTDPEGVSEEENWNASETDGWEGMRCPRIQKNRFGNREAFRRSFPFQRGIRLHKG